MLQVETSPKSISYSGTGNRLDARRVAIMTEDMGPMTDYLTTQIFGENLNPKVKNQALAIARSSFSEYQKLFSAAFPGRNVTIPETAIDDTINGYVGQVLTENPNAVVVINDRYIAPHIEDKFSGSIFRFSSTRMLLGNNTGDFKSVTMPRPGDPSFESQLEEIEKTLQKNGKTLNGTQVVFVDDVAVKHSTEDHLSALFSKHGAVINKKDNIYVYKVHFETVDPELDRRNSLLSLKNRVASTEQREMMPLPGGPIKGIGEHIAIQHPAQAPWGDGGILRTEGLITRRQLDIEELKLFINVFSNLEEVLQGSVRKDGSVFEKFSFADIRYMIPSSTYFGPSNMIRKFREVNGRNPEKLSDLEVVDYIRLALSEIENENKLYITHVIEDIDGVVAKMRYVDQLNKSYSTSFLGMEVKQRMTALVEEFQKQNATDVYMDFENPAQFINKNTEFGQYLVKTYGKEVEMTMEARFMEFYGDANGKQEFVKFKEEHAFLPEGYHEFRELSWGRVDLESAFEFSGSKARDFNQKALDNGANIVLLTAAPKVHALRMLQASGMADLISSDQIILLTVEDLYDPATLVEMGKDLVFNGLKSPDVHNPRKDHFNTDSVVYKFQEPPLALDKIKSLGKTHPHMMLGIGDQPHSDIGPAINIGGYGALVDGPDNLEGLWDHAYILAIERAIGMEAFLGNDDAIRRIKEGGNRGKQ